MKIKPAKRIAVVKEYYFSRKLREIAKMNEEQPNVINLGIGSPDLAPPQAAIEQLGKESRNPNNHAYQSYKGIPELRKAFSEWYAKYFQVDLDPNTEVLPLIGSKEGIMHISMSYLDPQDRVWLPNPGYPAYNTAATLAGASPETYALRAENNWLPDLEAMAKQQPEEVKLMWVNYPHMPTGSKADADFFKALIDFASTYNILLVNDNPYSFILNDNPLSLLSVEGSKAVAMELNSLSKSHNMAGWRIGMLAGAEEQINNVMKFKSNMDSGMFRPLQLAAVEALRMDEEWGGSLNTIYKKRRNKVYRLLDLLGCTYSKDQNGMFVWAALPGGFEDGYELSDWVLQQARVFLTPGGIFGDQGKQYIRVSLCKKIEEIEAAIDRIEKITGTHEKENVKYNPTR